MTEQEEIHMLQLVAISVASKCNTRESLEEQRLDEDSPYYTVAYADVIEGVEREILLLEAKKAPEEQVKAHETMNKVLREKVE